ncbi:MAG: ribosomal-processing cysteine protease Prp [Butyricicoccus sp.]
MIVITVSDTEITVTGHACCAPRGQDIVCAAVSALVQCLVRALDVLTPGRAECRANPGDAAITIRHPSEDTQLLTDAFRIGIADIAAAYPDNVSLVSKP